MAAAGSGGPDGLASGVVGLRARLAPAVEPPHPLPQTDPGNTSPAAATDFSWQTRLVNHRAPLYQSEQFCLAIRHGGEEGVQG